MAPTSCNQPSMSKRALVRISFKHSRTPLTHPGQAHYTQLGGRSKEEVKKVKYQELARRDGSISLENKVFKRQATKKLPLYH
ncbi:hypothetical protein CEXT_395451 [Caerostris extrusa]|uniref:Uncharacterized protein n=1 Tax=Caerostris extrusa TaxID=172846 RepID=A0AAV4XC93_CAEEX|nr:hypothetical protein CEXT_395451 [Caerostris extrusa]